jgi:4-amino-4-deoxy-L-arabinose transferase-like glycosyltransferase
MGSPLLRRCLHKLKAEAWRLALAAIVISAAGLALYWVFLVPIFMAPDEAWHLDYSFNIFSAGRLVNLREPLKAWNTGAGLHVYTQYLSKISNYSSMKFRYDVKAPPGSGTKEFYDEIDRNAPAEDSGGRASQPREYYGSMEVYPFGYYALLAAWLKLVALFSKRLTVLFFAGRILSVILLVPSLLLVYGVARELGFTRHRSLLLTFIVGFFPMTTFVASYIQADNLSLTLVLLCWYSALLARRRINDAWPIPLLGISLGLLCVTKYHFYIAVLLAVLPMLLAGKLTGRRRTGWARLLVTVLAPSLLLFCVQMWVTWGHGDQMQSNPNLQHQAFALAVSHGVRASVMYLLDGLAGAFANFYWNGVTLMLSSTFATFWGNFGWEDTPLVIWSPGVNEIIRSLIGALNVVAFIIMVVLIGRTIRRLLALGRKRGRLKALTLASSNPGLNSYLFFTVLMFCLFAVVRDVYAPQGRNWLPFILPIFLVTTHYAPRILPKHGWRVFTSDLMLVLLALYSVIGSYYAIQCLHARFYGQ